MMKLALLVLTLMTSSVFAYVPTVESLFRHGSNADVTANAISLTLVVKKFQASAGQFAPGILQDVSLLKDKRAEDFYRVFFNWDEESEVLKLAQTRYSNSTFSEDSLEHKIYHPNFTPFSIRPSVEELEKGVFYALLRSLVLNEGAHMINYLKSLEVPVKLNSELINRDKLELMAQYKRYLVTINNDRNARKTEVNPLRPDDPSERERVNKLLDESMYIDTKQVRLGRDHGEMAWLVNAGTLEAVFSYKERHLLRVRLKTAAGDYEISCQDYWLANGTHYLPRYLNVRTLSGESYRVELKGLRHYSEKEENLVKRLNKWDELLKTKTSQEQRPEFLL